MSLSRETAMKHWNKLSNEEKIELTNEHFKGRKPSSLTGREIEKMLNEEELYKN